MFPKTKNIWPRIVALAMIATLSDALATDYTWVGITLYHNAGTVLTIR